MVTNEILDKEPVNCGNCIEMKRQTWKRKGLYIAKCWSGNLDEKTFVLDGPGNNPLPVSWDKAKTCPDFDSMLKAPAGDDVEYCIKPAVHVKHKGGTTWQAMTLKHL